MINLKVLSTVAALALVLPMAAPVESYAAGRGGFGGGGGARMGGGGMHMGGGGGMHMGGGGGAFRAGAIGGGGGARFAASPGFARPSMGVAPAARFSGAAVGSRYAGNWNGGNRGNWNHGNRGNWNGGWRHRPHGGYWPGLVAGAVVGGALANSYAYYGDPYYYGNGYYDDGYYDDSTVAVVPGGGDDASYCAQRYRSYDPASGTYLGYDGQRHPCP